MTEEDCEIEYLDEDEDIIQQFVQNAPVVEKKPEVTPISRSGDDTDDPEDTAGEEADSLLVPKKRSDPKRKPKPDDDDSDYDPAEEIRQAMKKRRKPARNPPTNVLTVNKSAVPLSSPSQDTKPTPKLSISEYDIQERRKKGIRIPDFEDPLCLPVKAVVNNRFDMQKLKTWNRACLEHYKKNLEPFRPSEEPVVSSSRTAIFKKVKNSMSGQILTTVWNKIQVEDSNGKEKSEVRTYQLPAFREKVVLKPFTLAKSMPRRFSHKRQVLLTKEVNKDEETLVVYNPGDAVSAVYKEFKQSDASLEESEDRSPRLVIKEATCTKICAPCYQASWRGVRKRDDTSVQCAVCQRYFVSVYNLLSHLKAHHKNEEVRSHKMALARSLASVVDYHYRCRICQETFLSIKLLRKHVVKHRGEESFHCEIGNHVAK